MSRIIVHAHKAAYRAALLAGLTLALAPGVRAQPLDTRDAPLKMALSNLYGEEAFNTASQVCSKRFPDDATRWAESLSAWKSRRAVQLAEFRDLEAQLSAAVKALHAPASLTQEELLGLHTMASVWVLGSLAEAPDSQARRLCEGLRSRLDGNDPREQAIADQAQAAAKEILARLRAESP